MNKELLSILIPIIGLFIPVIWKIFKPLIYKKLKLDIGIRKYKNWKGEMIYIFPKKQKIRISVSVLARIERNGKYLLKSKNPNEYRQDSEFKPLGGVIKINDKISKKLNQKYEYDYKTRYSAKSKDFRIYKKIKNNKIIHKAIYENNLNYYKNELIREIREESKISHSKFKEIFEFKKNQPYSILINFTEEEFSFLGEPDYVHYIIFELLIKNNEKFKNTFNNNDKIKFLNLKGPENKAITAFLLNKKVRFRNFQTKKKRHHFWLKIKKLFIS